mmetsp:Transcript_65001/g.188462  ORF Transcript_65001/g.188462 Transcript_65001/m.188462 type:complete len:255 (-) Transcript_65001:538-1302(-)
MANAVGTMTSKLRSATKLASPAAKPKPYLPKSTVASRRNSFRCKSKCGWKKRPRPKIVRIWVHAAQLWITTASCLGKWSVVTPKERKTSPQTNARAAGIFATRTHILHMSTLVPIAILPQFGGRPPASPTSGPGELVSSRVIRASHAEAASSRSTWHSVADAPTAPTVAPATRAGSGRSVGSMGCRIKSGKRSSASAAGSRWPWPSSTGSSGGRFMELAETPRKTTSPMAWMEEVSMADLSASSMLEAYTAAMM